MPIWESRFVIYSMLASFLPCFPQLKTWAVQDPEGPKGAILADGQGLEVDPKLVLDQNAAGHDSKLRSGNAGAVDHSADVYLVK